MTEETVNVGAHMPKNLERRARIAAARLGISRSDFFRQALENFLLIKEQELGKINEFGKTTGTEREGNKGR